VGTDGSGDHANTRRHRDFGLDLADPTDDDTGSAAPITFAADTITSASTSFALDYRLRGPRLKDFSAMEMFLYTEIKKIDFSTVNENPIYASDSESADEAHETMDTGDFDLHLRAWRNHVSNRFHPRELFLNPHPRSRTHGIHLRRKDSIPIPLLIGPTISSVSKNLHRYLCALFVPHRTAKDLLQRFLTWEDAWQHHQQQIRQNRPELARILDGILDWNDARKAAHATAQEHAEALESSGGIARPAPSDPINAPTGYDGASERDIELDLDPTHLNAADDIIVESGATPARTFLESLSDRTNHSNIPLLPPQEVDFTPDEDSDSAANLKAWKKAMDAESARRATADRHQVNRSVCNYFAHNPFKIRFISDCSAA